MRIAGMIPTINYRKAQVISEIVGRRAGFPIDIFLYEDKKRSGWVSVCNSFVKKFEYDFYVYLADDVFPGKNWLSKALKIQKEKNAGLVGLNGGKWDGLIADFGLVERNWMLKNYNGNLFFDGYKSHYGDTELTMIAIEDRKYAYDPSAIMMEIHDKFGYKNNKQDQALFKSRKTHGFDAKVLDRELLEAYN